MKFITLFIVFFSANLFAASNDVLKCLGREEAYIHKNKIGGSFKSLNQAMIGELILLGKSLSLAPSLENELCSKETIFPSFILLEKILNDGARTLTYRSGSLTSTKDFSDRQTVRELNKNIFDIFIDFLTKLQAEVNDPHCLTRQFPELKEFYIQAQHVYEEQGSKRILSNFRTLPKLLKSIKSSEWKKSCQTKS